MFKKLWNKVKNIPSYKRILLILSIFMAYDIFIIKSPLKFFKDILGGRYVVNYLVSTIALVFFILAIDLLFKGRLMSKILAALLLIVPLGIQTAHFAFYNMPLNAFGIRFFFSEPLLTTQLGLENINYIKVTIFLLFCITLIYLFLPNHKNIKYKKIKLSIYTLIFTPLVILCGVNWYLILDYQNAMIAAYAAVPETSRSLYFKKIKGNKPEISLLPTDKKLPNIVWIVGESVAKSHMSLYGYKRKTTPNLDALHDKGELIAMQNVVSIGPHTLISVPYMLVGRQNIDPSGIIYSSPNIFDYAKARNYDTAFISAQDLRWKNFDQLSGNGVVDFYRSGPDFNTNVSVSKGADDMKVLDQSILPHLSQMRSPFLLIAHMDGSHYPYNIHSEKKYKKFFPENSANGTNAYDNTIVYSDVYLSKLIKEARKKDPNVWIFYTTDHGQNVALAKEQIVLKEQELGEAHAIENKIKAENNKTTELVEVKSEQKSIFSNWRNKINEMFKEKDTNDDESKVTFNQGYDIDIIHNAFFVVPPSHMKKEIKEKEFSALAQSDIFATILDLMDIQNPASHIDGISLLKQASENRLRVSTGFVITNDNIPEAQVTLPDKSSYFIDFARNSVSVSKDKSVIRLEDAPKEIQDLFNNVEKEKHLNLTN